MEFMHPLIKTLIDEYSDGSEINEPVLDALDDVAHCILDKDGASRSPEDYGPVSLSAEESSFLTVWSAWTAANGGGATEALSGVECDTLTDALRELGAPEITDAIVRLNKNIEEFERANKDLGWKEQDAKFTQLSNGPWWDDNCVFDEPEDWMPRILVEYLLKNRDHISIAGYESDAIVIEKKRTPERHLIPSDYEGVAITIYEQSGFPELPVSDGYRIHEYAEDGILITSSKQEFGSASDEILDVLKDDTHRRIGSGSAGDRRDHDTYTSGSLERDGEPNIGFAVKVIGSVDYWNGFVMTEYDRKLEEAIRKLESCRTQGSEQAHGDPPTTRPASEDGL